MPDERYRAVLKTEQFLYDLITDERLPEDIRDRARNCIRHFPSSFDMSLVSDENGPFYKYDFNGREIKVADGEYWRKMREIK
jgi:hypothetical protein